MRKPRRSVRGRARSKAGSERSPSVRPRWSPEPRCRSCISTRTPAHDRAAGGSPVPGSPADVALAPGVNQLVPVVSPDGRRVAFSASRPGEPVRIWVRSLESLDARSLSGTDNARGPFWSPDSRSLAFFADGKLKTIDAAGGPVQTVCRIANSAASPGASWSRTGAILFARRTGGLMKVAASGGEPTQTTVVDTTNGDASHAFPTLLPDGRQFLYLSRPSNTLWLGTLDSSEARRLVTSDSQAFYADGHLLFARQGVLLAQRYDVSRARLAGDPTAIAERLAVDSILGVPAFSSSETGVLVYRTGAGSSLTQLTWVDRSGNLIGTPAWSVAIAIPCYRTTERASRWKRRISRIARRT